MWRGNYRGDSGRGGRGRGRGDNQHGATNHGPTGNPGITTAETHGDSQDMEGLTTTNDGVQTLNIEANPVVPPDPPSLLPRIKRGAAFGVQKCAIDTRQELKLSIEFPLSKGKSGNDIALFYKRFMTVLFASTKDMQLLKWEGSTENPILKAADIAYDENTIGEFYSGMKIQNDRQRMIGYSRILTPDPFWKIKRNVKLFDWLQTNKVWVKPTILSSSQHVKIGWLLRSHPTYTNYARATADLLRRIGENGTELELSPHSISHTSTSGEVLRTRALKVVTTAEHSDKILEGLITALTGDPAEEYADSTTAAFKLIPFQNTAINRDGIEELVRRQNDFLHRTSATSVVNVGTGDESFSSEVDGDTIDDGNIRQWAMDARTEEGTYLFHSVEPGRTGQCYFLHEKVRQAEAEKWLDDCFDRILQKYGADTCRKALGGESHVRRETHFRPTPKITEYLKGLNLSGTVQARKQEAHLSAPPIKKTRAPPRIRFGNVKERGAWGNLRDTESESPPKKTKVDTMIDLTNTLGASSGSFTLAGGTQDTLDSTVSSLQSSFQKEIERANTLRKEAAEATEASLASMQKEVNDKLTMMDSTIRTVHEGQTLNDKNIQLLMKKMDILGEQMKMMHQHKEETTPSAKDAHMIAEVKESGSPQRKRSLPIIPYKDTQELEEDWDENFAESTEAFDTIMTDAETKKRTAAVDVAKTTKPKKTRSPTKPITRARLGRGA